jgi:predicted ester cyclase
VMRLTMRGTDKGGSVALGTSPTGKQIEFEVMGIARLADGRIVEERSMTDIFSVMRQLGVVPKRG